ncbi:hypothetical protein ACVWYH_007949 [Bradyrhizobium sp. GM24.11]
MQFASTEFDPSIEIYSPELDDFNHPGVAERGHPGSRNF